MEPRHFVNQFGFGLDIIARTADRLREPMRRGFFTINLNITSPRRKREARKVFEASLNYLQTPEGRAEVLRLEEEEDHYMDAIPGYYAMLARRQQAREQAALQEAAGAAGSQLLQGPNRNSVSTSNEGALEVVTLDSSNSQGATTPPGPPPMNPGPSSASYNRNSWSETPAGSYFEASVIPIAKAPPPELVTINYILPEHHPLQALTREHPALAADQDPAPPRCLVNPVPLNLTRPGRPMPGPSTATFYYPQGVQDEAGPQPKVEIVEGDNSESGGHVSAFRANATGFRNLLQRGPPRNSPPAAYAFEGNLPGPDPEPARGRKRSNSEEDQGPSTEKRLRRN